MSQYRYVKPVELELQFSFEQPFESAYKSLPTYYSMSRFVLTILSVRYKEYEETLPTDLYYIVRRPSLNSYETILRR